ncbi:hypothetical protein [Pseudonocardia acidicola]|uniref:Uncharacterized protein n=1 Tax=Pseudonocardia acidicola TaxID=2724939 RepID=A0ABX1SET5_9PSEU|nr:hypothetical protein [Pseudonocardia acidicola]NMH98764.1 hypothetical protein [Pseudonocardia acidicola]
MPSPRIWGPVILQAAASLVQHHIKPGDQGVVETYWDIVFAASHQHAVQSFTERADENLDQTAYEFSQILRQGWLRGDGIDSPQAVFTESSSMRPICIENPASNLYGDKPEGAFWTSSYLPDGSSAWTRSEDSEFSGQNRPLRNFTFEPIAPDAVFLIRSLEDYQELVTTYPREIGNNQVAVDWPRAASDYVAVRLTAAGLALAHHYRVATPAGTAQLTGWDAESTAWLHLPRNARLSV